MADFATWSHANLVKFAQENAAERNAMLAASIKQANALGEAYVALKKLADEHARICDMFCCKPEHSDAYNKARSLIK